MSAENKAPNFLPKLRDNNAIQSHERTALIFPSLSASPQPKAPRLQPPLFLLACLAVNRRLEKNKFRHDHPFGNLLPQRTANLRSPDPPHFADAGFRYRHRAKRAQLTTDNFVWIGHLEARNAPESYSQHRLIGTKEHHKQTNTTTTPGLVPAHPTPTVSTRTHKLPANLLVRVELPRPGLLARYHRNEE